MNSRRKIVLWLVLLAAGAGVVCLRFSPAGQVKAVVRAYNRWTDPGLIQEQGLGGLIKFMFLNWFASNRLEALLADDCQTTNVTPDGSISSGKGKDLVAGLTGLRFSSCVEQIIIKKPIITIKEDGYWIEMQKAFYEGNSVIVVDEELVLRNIKDNLLISEIKRTGRQPSNEELTSIKSISHSGCYNFSKGLGGRYSSLYPDNIDYSPDGTKILFSAFDKRGKYGNICLMAADGTQVKQLTNNKYYEAYPRFTPDGQSIVFYCDKDNYAGEPYLRDIDGSNCRRLFPGIDCVSDVVYSPDGKSIAFTIQQGLIREVYKMEAAAGKITPLTSDGKENSALLFSSDGSDLYFKQKWHEYDRNLPLCEEIFVVNLEVRKLRQLTHDRMQKTPVAVFSDTLFYSKTLWSIPLKLGH